MEQEPDCPICLDEMSPADLQHPLQCQHKCGYNFCLTCIESLITSSRDDYMEASDGNMHVKVFLHCPNCRSDLGSTIRDTVILRKAQMLELHSQESEIDLSEREQRLKLVINDKQVQEFITEARRREATFFGTKLEEELKENDEYASDDEIGVEADIDVGVHKSFRYHEKDSHKVQRRTIDPTLFQGLECIMTPEEQVVVTQLMTSGDPEKLSLAAETLHNITIRVQTGVVTPRTAKDRRSSIFVLMDESKKANQKADVEKPATSQHSKVARHKAIEKEIREYNQFIKLHPLPVRMPKYVEFHLHDTDSYSFLPFKRDTRPLTFCNDVWDGSVMDAYSKITISGANHVTQRKSENMGVLNVLYGGGGKAELIDTEKERVLVASVRSEGGRQGVLKGDVVTHFNGEEFKGTADDLDAAILECADGTFSLILNAERSVAEALKRRAMV